MSTNSIEDRAYEELCDRARDFMDNSPQALPSKVMADFARQECSSLTAALGGLVEASKAIHLKYGGDSLPVIAGLASLREVAAKAETLTGVGEKGNG